MVTFNFKICVSDDNYVNKEFTTGSSYQGVLKSDCSIEHPVLIIKGLEEILNYNYVEIPQFKRSYFIREKTILENGYYQITCEVDTLETYKETVLNNPCIIEASENAYFNDYLRHESFVATVKHKTDIITFPAGLNNAGEFILITAGG